jgi:hypothetical protein
MPMVTREQWLTSTVPADLLCHVRRNRAARLRYQHPAWFARCKKDLAPRKMRLFLLAYCYRLCAGNTDPSCAQLLAVAERFVETPPPPSREENRFGPYYLSPGLCGAVYSALRNPVGLAAAHLRLVAGKKARAEAGERAAGKAAQQAAVAEEAREQCRLLRDIFNPFGDVPPRKGKRLWAKQRAGWLRSNGGVVKALAEGVYAERAFDRLPILADALEEAGCGNAEMLAHLRGAGPHVRGCWALDLLLGKE